MIRENQVRNCPITVDDANRAIKIYGPDVAALRGKTTRTTPTHVTSDQLRPLSFNILYAHKEITLCVDIFFVDGFIFVGTVSQHLQFITIEHIPNRTMLAHVFPCLGRVHNLCHARGFKSTTIHANEEFVSLRDPLLTLGNIRLNIAATNEHVPEIERAIRTLKERNRTTVSGLPYTHYPKQFKISLLSSAASWLNMFPRADGVSDTMSPRTIVTGLTADYNTHCRVPIGAYCEVHNENDPSNTDKPRTSHAIALKPTGNIQGSYHFLSLDTGKRVSRRRWTELPITTNVIACVHACVHALAIAERTHDPNAPNFHFEWAPNQPLADIVVEHQEEPHMIILEGANDDTDGEENKEQEQENEDIPHQLEPEDDEENEKATHELEPEDEDEDQGAQAAPDEIEEEQGAQGAQGAPSKNRHLGSASSPWQKNPIYVCFNPLSFCATYQNTNLGPSNTPFPTG
jgi:hypothetical protein